MKRFFVIVVLVFLGNDNASGRLRKFQEGKDFCIVLNVIYLFSAPYIKTCRRNEPNMANCILNSINLIKPQIVSG
jgi:hypothetical protein